MVKDASKIQLKPVLLNIGCGSIRLDGWIGVDAYGEPDVKHDLNVTPWPFKDNSVDKILAAHVFEHLDNWWGAFLECVRILKPLGTLEVRVPHESSTTALGYRDHIRPFASCSWYGIEGTSCGTNAWASEEPRLPMRIVANYLKPFPKYQILFYWFPWIGRFCSFHMRNFIHEQRWVFEKLPQREGSQ